MAPSIRVAAILLVYIKWCLAISQRSPALAYRSLQQEHETFLANQVEFAAQAAKMISTAESLHRFAESSRKNTE
jgi:hypothetical protein